MNAFIHSSVQSIDRSTDRPTNRVVGNNPTSSSVQQQTIIVCVYILNQTMYLSSRSISSLYIALLLRLGDSSLFTDVNTVKELTKILLANVGSLLDLRTHERNHGNIVSTELNLVLDIVTTNKFHTIHKLDLADPLFSQKVANLHSPASKGNVDGEMRVDKAHLVDESLRHSGKHVVNVRADRPDRSELLTVGEPQIDADKLLGRRSLVAFFRLDLDNAQVHGNVLKGASEATAGASHFDNTGLDLDSDCTIQIDRDETKR